MRLGATRIKRVDALLLQRRDAANDNERQHAVRTLVCNGCNKSNLSFLLLRLPRKPKLLSPYAQPSQPPSFYESMMNANTKPIMNVLEKTQYRGLRQTTPTQTRPPPPPVPIQVSTSTQLSTFN